MKASNRNPSGSLHQLVKQYGIRFKHSLGQNLLLDTNINRIMVQAADLSKEDDVLEVGAGLGSLTELLRRAAGRVLAVEIDRAFMPCLQDRFGNAENVRLFRGDILNHDLRELLDEFLPDGTCYKMVSNLPYYITTPILFHFWESAVPFSRIVVMVQEEVALRMTAQPGDAHYGLLSLAAQYYAAVDIVHKAPRTCFRPQPRVDSCIVRLRGRTQTLHPDVDGRFLLRIMRAAFAHRRKTLKNALVRSGAFGAPGEAVLAALEVSGIDPMRRPETLTLDEFAALARELKKRL